MLLLVSHLQTMVTPNGEIAIVASSTGSGGTPSTPATPSQPTSPYANDARRVGGMARDRRRFP